MSEITDCDPIDEITLRAQLMVCANSDNAAEAELVMRMLGIHPDQDDDESYATKVLGKHRPARMLCVRGIYSVVIDTDAWTLNYGIEEINTIREDVREYIRQFIDDAVDQLLTKPKPNRGRNLAGGNRRKSVPSQDCRQ
jgi:hypothetical protein